MSPVFWFTWSSNFTESLNPATAESLVLADQHLDLPVAILVGCCLLGLKEAVPQSTLKKVC